MAKKANRSSDRLALNPSVHRTIVREFTDLLEPLLDEHFRIRYLSEEWLSKINETDGSITPLERRSAAIEKWLRTEERNARTNQRLLLETTSIAGVSTDLLFETASRYVSEIIGAEPPEEIWSYGRFSGGASTSRTRLAGRSAQKFRDTADITEAALPYFPRYSEGLVELLNADSFRIVKGNVLFTVPKNALIDRVACKEPDYNMYLQLAVGGYIRSRLKRVGIDLNDQTRNGLLAREGSITDQLATVDLSSASDSITISLVNKLLPPDWFILLNNLRSQFTEIDGVYHENNMFSSMGNGFTFELESLCFFALVRSLNYHFGFKGTVSVYGDDIITPAQSVSYLRDWFGFCGLLFNLEKTFGAGPFRESCGMHWYNGLDVKPFYLRQPINHVSRLIHFLNRLRAWASVGGICDPRFYSFWKKWAKLVPSQFKGGWDCEDVSSLVSNCDPRNTLVKVSRKVTKKDFGTYLTWHNQKTIASDSPFESEEQLPIEQFVVRRRRKIPDGTSSFGWDVLERPLFPQEVMGT